MQILAVIPHGNVAQSLLCALVVRAAGCSQLFTQNENYVNIENKISRNKSVINCRTENSENVIIIIIGIGELKQDFGTVNRIIFVCAG